MRQTLALAVLFVALASSVYGLYGRTAVGRSESVSGGFAADFPAGGLLRVHAPSGAVRIVGGSEDRIVVRYGGKEPFIGREPKVTSGLIGPDWPAADDTRAARPTVVQQITARPRTCFDIGSILAGNSSGQHSINTRTPGKRSPDRAARTER